MGIRFFCPQGHKLNVKAFQAGRRGICPFCGAKFTIPAESTRPPSGRGGDEPEEAVAGSETAAESPAASFEQALEQHVQSADPIQTPQAAAAETPQPAAAPVADDAAPETQPAAPTVEAMPEATPAAAPEEQPAPIVEPEPQTQPQAEPEPPRPPETSEAPPLVDPLSEAPDAVWYVRPPSGGQFGPAQSSVVRSWLGEGRVSPETLVWREGWPEWQEAGAVFPELQQATPNVQGGPDAPPLVGGVDNGQTQGSIRPGTRRRKQGPNVGLIVVLVLAVVLLFSILIGILTGAFGTSDTPDSSTTAAQSEVDWHVAEWSEGCQILS